MPDWTYTTSSGTDWDSDAPSYVTIPSMPQQREEEWRWEREYEKLVLQLGKEREEEKQLAKDKIKYPLFFLKEGII